MGGYNRTIANDRGSPIAGRQAWSGNSQGFTITVVNVPGIAAVTLRWRMASDNSGSGEGWRVDTMHVTWCRNVGCPQPTPRHADAQRLPLAELRDAVSEIASELASPDLALHMTYSFYRNFCVWVLSVFANRPCRGLSLSR